ncbi:MAG: hypothetical protein JWN11_625 [Hyphomicrobiales bacterium]|nr:hypothetical protein [Hyphomicrobiales bacterium]
MTSLLEALEASGPAAFLRTSFYLYPLLSAAHILAIGATVTSAMLMDLRIIGIGRSISVERVIKYLRPVAMMALGVAVVTGLLLFSVRPLHYVESPAFQLKLVVVFAAILNAVAFNILRRRAEVSKRPLLILAMLSLLLWPSALIAGRFIGFLS